MHLWCFLRVRFALSLRIASHALLLSPACRPEALRGPLLRLYMRATGVVKEDMVAPVESYVSVRDLFEREVKPRTLAAATMVRSPDQCLSSPLPQRSAVCAWATPASRSARYAAPLQVCPCDARVVAMGAVDNSAPGGGHIRQVKVSLAFHLCAACDQSWVLLSPCRALRAVSSGLLTES